MDALLETSGSAGRGDDQRHHGRAAGLPHLGAGRRAGAEHADAGRHRGRAAGQPDGPGPERLYNQPNTTPLHKQTAFPASSELPEVRTKVQLRHSVGGTVKNILAVLQALVFRKAAAHGCRRCRPRTCTPQLEAALVLQHMFYGFSRPRLRVLSALLSDSAKAVCQTAETVNVSGLQILDATLETGNMAGPPVRVCHKDRLS